MKFDVVIATCNRPQRVVGFVQQILKCQPLPEAIIIVDSSDMENRTIQDMHRIKYIRSSHKNQPYQRMLGAMAANHDIVVFFDDDLQIVNDTIFQLLLNEYQNPEVVGVTVKIEYHNSTFQKLESAPIKIASSFFDTFTRFTGVPIVKPGKIGPLGLVGAFPEKGGEVQYFNGPNMTFRRAIVSRIISSELLTLYEVGLGKGEDKAISMLANQFGTLIFVDENCLHHPPVDSAYFDNHYGFFRRYIFSRWFLSKNYCRVFGKSLLIERLRFAWFALWRLLIALVFLLAKYSTDRKQKLKGIWTGFWFAMINPGIAKKMTQEVNWKADAIIDLKQSGYVET